MGLFTEPDFVRYPCMTGRLWLSILLLGKTLKKTDTGSFYIN